MEAFLAALAAALVALVREGLLSAAACNRLAAECPELRPALDRLPEARFLDALAASRASRGQAPMGAAVERREAVAALLDAAARLEIEGSALAMLRGAGLVIRDSDGVDDVYDGE